MPYKHKFTLPEIGTNLYIPCRLGPEELLYIYLMSSKEVNSGEYHYFIFGTLKNQVFHMLYLLPFPLTHKTFCFKVQTGTFCVAERVNNT